MFQRILASLLLLFIAFPVLGQSPIEGLLQELSETEAQREIARVVENICPSGQISDSLLQERCNEIVGAVFSGEDLDGVRQALQALAPEENLVVGSSLVDSAVTQLDFLKQRMASVRSGGGQSPVFSISQPLGNSTQPHGASTTALSSSWTNPYGSSQEDPAAPEPIDSQSGWSFFASATTSTVDRDVTSRVTGFEGDQAGVLAGFDYRVGSHSVLGVALGLETDSSTMDSDSGSVDSDTGTLSLHHSWFGKKAVWLETVAGFGWTDIEQSRRVRYTLGSTQIDRLTVGDTESRQTFASVAAGWDFGRGAFGFTPEIGFEYLESSVDAFSESVAGASQPSQWMTLSYEDQNFQSIKAQLGVRADYAKSTSFGVVVPQIEVSLFRELDDSADAVHGRFAGDSLGERYTLLTDEADTLYGRVGLGAVFVFGHGRSFFVAYDKLIGYEGMDTETFNVGLRLGG